MIENYLVKLRQTFGYASRITPGYAHATWDAMVAAVESLERPSSLKPSMFAVKSAAGQPKAGETRKAVSDYEQRQTPNS